jgi:hypothetical protein
MQVIYSNDKVLSSRGDLIRAKRSEDGDVVLYIGAITDVVRTSSVIER